MDAQVPEKTASRTSLDSNDPTEARLAGCARRISQLLAAPAVTANADVESSLDDFLGAVYALIRAKKKGFQDRRGRRIKIKPVAQRAARIATGHVKTDGLWIAGFYLNNALFRTAAVYHRILKAATGTHGSVPALQLDALLRYAAWNSIRLYKIYNQVNELKHDPRGVYHGRLVSYDDALTAACDLLDLIEAWMAAQTPPAPTP
jgi:hypothetical protein